MHAQSANPHSFLNKNVEFRLDGKLSWKHFSVVNAIKVMLPVHKEWFQFCVSS